MIRQSARGLARFALLVSCSAAAAAQPQEPPSTQAGPVSREEHERLRREVESLRRELAAVKQERQAQAEETDKSLEEIDETVAQIRKDLKNRAPGTANFLLSGNATISYFDRENDDSTFSVVWRPAFLWKLSDKLLFEAKPEVRLRSGTEEVSLTLEYANLSYVVNDWMVVGAGKFMTPFGLFPDRFYPGKMLDEPLVYQRSPAGIAPRTDVGAFARGAFPVGPYEANYAAWVSNGPVVRTDAGRAGTLDFGGAFRDVNDNKSVGARVGFLPFPALEVGGSILYAEADPHGFPQTPARLYGVDAQYYDTLRPLKGAVDLRAEWVWSVVDDATYDPAGDGGFGPLTFDNNRSGGYVEASYRPSLVASRFVRNFEFVSRYDWLDVPDAAPGPRDEQRLTLAVLYWLNATTSLRVGYAFSEPEGPDRDTFFMQASVGF
jgi:hypothetical protein